MSGPDWKPAADDRPATRRGSQVERAVQRGHPVHHILDARPTPRPGQRRSPGRRRRRWNWAGRL